MTDQEILDCKRRANGKRVPILIFPTDALYDLARELQLSGLSGDDRETCNAKGRETAVRAAQLGLATFEFKVDEESLVILAGQRIAKP